MVDSVSADSYASSAIAAADIQIAAVTDSIATQIDTAQPTAPFGSSAVAAPPVTGTQPSNAASQVFQALQSPASTSTGAGATGSGAAGVAPSVSRSDNYDISYQPDSPSADAQGLVARPNVNPGLQTAQLVASANSFSTTAQFLQTGTQLSHRILDLTT